MFERDAWTLLFLSPSLSAIRVVNLAFSHTILSCFILAAHDPFIYMHIK